ncbi:hypothetical protein J1TS1_20180 [Shouchella clausii]|nr:hypothetical protein J1TS1_20180 [Shouchella clausii]
MLAVFPTSRKKKNESPTTNNTYYYDRKIHDDSTKRRVNQVKLESSIFSMNGGRENESWTGKRHNGVRSI